jgi:hypothetical protein
MKNVLLLIIALTGLRLTAMAQCELPVNEGRQIHVRDTTFLELVLDTTSVGPGYYCTWYMPDGSTRTGVNAYYPFTEAGYTGAMSYTINGPGCTLDGSMESEINLVFNCDALATYSWSYYSQAVQTGPNANDIAVQPGFFTYWDTALKTNMYFDWGNGHTVFKRQETDSFTSIGGIDDPTHSSQYIYAGTYPVTFHYFYSYDTMTCPMVYADTVALIAGGMPAIPQIMGVTSYCAGDTLRLWARDTTAQFGNLYHMPGRTLPVIENSSYTALSGYQQVDGSTIGYSWYDANYNNLSFHDSSLVLHDIDARDSGVYRLFVYDIITQRDTEVLVHINITGSVLSVDSAVKTSCAVPGNIYLNLHRANDSVAITYTVDNIPQVFYGRANAHGSLILPALTSGTYADIQARFVGDPCPSNICHGPYRLPIMNRPVVPAASYNVCAGGSITLHASGALPGDSYLWSGPYGYSSSSDNPVITAPATVADQIYSVYINRPDCGLSQPAIVHLIVTDNSAPDISGYHFSSLCQGQHVTLLSGANVSVISSDTTVVNHDTAQAPGTVTLTWVASNACGTASLAEAVTVLPSPVLPSISGPNALCGSTTATYTIGATGGSWSTPWWGDLSSAASSGGSSTVVLGLHGFGTYLTYTKTVDGCTSVIKKFVKHDKTGLEFNYLTLGLYPEETATISINAYYTPPSRTYTLNSDSVIVLTDNVLAAGSRYGSALLSKIDANECGTDTFTKEVFVSDWITTTIAGGGSENTPFWLTEGARNANLSAMSEIIARDSSGHLFVYNGRHIERIDRDGGIVTIAGNTNSDEYSGDGGPATEAGISMVDDMICDRHGNLYLSCPANAVIRKISTDGTITRFAGIPGLDDSWYGAPYPFYAPYSSRGYSGDGGPATAARISVGSMATDGQGNLYFSDPAYNCIRKIDATGIITTIGGNGIYGFSGDGGPATAAAIGQPMGIAVDTAGNVVVSTFGRLRKIDPSGNISTIAGVIGGLAVPGGLAMNTQPIFRGPVKADKQGNIFVSGFESLLKIDAAGVVTTVAGHNAYVSEWDAVAAHIWCQSDIAPDDSGSVYAIRPYWSAAPSTISVIKAGKPSIEVLSSADSLCGSAAVTFRAIGHNNGDHPSFQWKKNGIVVGTDAQTYYDPAIVAGDTVSVKVYLSSGGLLIAQNGKKMFGYSGSGAPVTIGGASSVCIGTTASLSSSIGGGIWSIDASGAAILSGNIVTGVAAGMAIISYSVTNSCGTSADTMLVTIDSLPSAGTIAGTPSVCPAATTTLTNTVAGGTWSSSSSSATITSGVVTGVIAGTAIISYSVTNSCGMAVDTIMITINSLPNAGIITGIPSVCAASATTLSNATTGGTWSSSSSTATVADGVVTGAIAGTAVISYNVTNECGTATDTMEVTVNALPDAGTITGVPSVCAAATTTLTNTVTGGIWSSSTTDVTVSGGIVTGTTTGTAIISYAVTGVCGTATDTMEISVLPLPDAGAVSGSAFVCIGSQITLTTTIGGGSWSSSTTDATIVDGVVSGITDGSAVITYSVSNSCGTATDTMAITVSPAANAGAISGSSTICIAAIETLTASIPGGTWSATGTHISIAADGSITAVSAGAETVVYTVSSACGTDTATFAVTVLGAPSAGSILGTDSLCQEASMILTESVGGGVWFSSNSSAATINSSGLVTGITPGISIISYVVSNTCGTDTAYYPVYIVPVGDCNTGIAGTTPPPSISIYPNPSSGTFMVQIPGAVNNATITVTDISGKVLQVLHPQPGEHQTQVSLTNLASGTYMVKVEADGVQYRDKLVLW